MFERFNAYDFYGYFIPGAYAVVAAGTFWLIGFMLFAGDMPSMRGIDLGTSVLLLVVSYVLGHVIQTLAQSLAWPSREARTIGRRILAGEPLGPNQPPVLSRGLLDAFQRAASHAAFAGDVADDATKRQESFDLAYNRVASLPLGRYVEIYNGLYAMYRGLYFVSRVGLAVLILGLVAWWFVRLQVRDYYFEAEVLGALAAVVLAVLSWLTLGPFRRRHREFAVSFVKAVCLSTINAERRAGN
jgi:hypothetical protein